MDGFLKFRWIITCGVIILVPLMVRSAGHPNAPLSATAIEGAFSRLPSLEDLEYMAYSLDVVQRIPIEAAEVLGIPERDPVDLQMEFALTTFRGLGTVLGQDLSDQDPAYLTALEKVIHAEEALLAHYPFMHLAVLFHFFFPTDDNRHDPRSLEETPILAPFQAPELNPIHLDFSLALLHRTLEDLHNALILPEAKWIIEFLIQADSQNTYKLAAFGYQLTLLTYLVISNAQAQLASLQNDRTPDPTLKATLLKTRNAYGPSFMRAPHIFESLATRTTQPDAAHIATHISSCLQIGKTHATELLFTPETAPVALDGTQTWLNVFTDPDIIRRDTSFTEASPTQYETTLHLIWNTYIEDKLHRENITTLCGAHPQKPPLQKGQDTLNPLWCIEDYRPATVIELIIALTLLEQFGLQPNKTQLDATWSEGGPALTSVLQFLHDTTSEGTSLWDRLVQTGLIALQSTVAQNYPELLEGEPTRDTPINWDFDTPKSQANFRKQQTLLRPDATLDFTLHRKPSLRNLLTMLIPGATMYPQMDPQESEEPLPPNSSCTPESFPLITTAAVDVLWPCYLTPPMTHLLETLLSSIFLEPFLTQATPTALASDTPWDFPNLTYRLAQAYGAQWAGPIQQYLEVTRNPETLTLSFLEALQKKAQDSSNPEGHIFKPLSLFTFVEAAQASAKISLLDPETDPAPLPALQAWIGAYPCDADPHTQTPDIIMFNKIYQDPDLTFQEAEKNPQDQNTFNTWVVPETQNFVDALLSSLRLKLHEQGSVIRRLMYVRWLSPMVRFAPFRRLTQNPLLRPLLHLEGEEIDASSVSKSLITQALSPSVLTSAHDVEKTKTDLFAAYQDPSHIPVIYKDLWWPKLELGLPSYEPETFAQAIQAAGQAVVDQLYIPRSSGASPHELTLVAQTLKTKMTYLIGKQDLWVLDPDSLYLLGDIFRKLLWEQLNTPAFVGHSPHTLIEPKILEDALVYTALHLRKAQHISDLLAEFEDHPDLDALADPLSSYTEGPIRSVIFLFGMLFDSEPSELSFQDRIQHAWSDLRTSIPMLRQSGESMSIAEGLGRVAAQYVFTRLPRLVGLAANPVPSLAEPAYAWVQYFKKHYVADPLNIKAPVEIAVLPTDPFPQEWASHLTPIFKVFEPFVRLESTESTWQVHILESDEPTADLFIREAHLDPTVLSKDTP